MKPLTDPETIEKAKEVTEEGAKKVLNEMPQLMKDIWRNEAVPIWKKMWVWFKGVWADYIRQPLSDFWYLTIKPRIQSLIQEVKDLLGKEAEEKIPVIKEEFEKERKEIREELPRASKSLWQRFKELIQ